MRPQPRRTGGARGGGGLWLATAGY